MSRITPIDTTLYERCKYLEWQNGAIGAWNQHYGNVVRLTREVVGDWTATGKVSPDRMAFLGAAVQEMERSEEVLKATNR